MPRDQMDRLVEEELREHVAEIMFDPMEAADRDCVLCQRALKRGMWKQWGVDDPFGPEPGED